MILGFDIGNTHICAIIYNLEGKILEKFRIPSTNIYTEDTIFAVLKVLANEKNINLNDIEDVIISSVVPHLNEIFMFLSRKYFKKEPYILTSSFLNEDILKLPNASERKLGSDRILTILATKKMKKHTDYIIIDFGTAITFEVISGNNYLGGAILPGIELSINALFTNTAKLPKVRFEKPDTPLANTTISQINSGIYYLNVGGIKELITMYKKEVPDAYVIATGGQGKEISKDLKEYINEYIADLCENGLFEFYTLSKKQIKR